MGSYRTKTFISIALLQFTSQATQFTHSKPLSNSAAGSVCPELCCPHQSPFRTLPSPKKKPARYLPSPSPAILSLPPPLATTNLPSVSLDLSVLEISYEQAHRECDLLDLASFTQRDVFMVHPCCSLLVFRLFYGRVILQHRDIPHFVCSVII